MGWKVKRLGSHDEKRKLLLDLIHMPASIHRNPLVTAKDSSHGNSWRGVCIEGSVAQWTRAAILQAAIFQFPTTC
jgi:hypothetical protein